MKTLIATALTVLVVLGLQPPALAGETKRLSTKHAVTTSEGWTRAQATVRFPSKYAFDIRGWVADVCPGDGRGAYLYVDYARGEGWSIFKLAAKDINGCGNGRKRFDPAPVKFAHTAVVHGVRFKLCEIDADGTKTQACVYKSFDNWRV